ncbi:hypothetical protein BDV06DRAFT_198560 [Aspergillus oleicola]
MATFENALYSLPTSPFTEPLWTGWNSDTSPTTSDDASLKMDSSYQAPVYPFPDHFYFLDTKWSDQTLAALSSFVPASNAVPMGQFSDNTIDMPNCASPLDTLAAPIFSAPIASSSTHDLTAPSPNSFHDYSTTTSGATTPSDHSSPAGSDSNTAPSSSSPTPPVQSHTHARPTRDTKTPIRCWEHRCGGRAFSSLGNYERHIREKSGRAKSFSCEQCGQRFTRSTAKNKHIRYGRCRARHPR